MKNSRLKKIDSAQLVVFIHLSLLTFFLSLLSNQSFFSRLEPFVDSSVFMTIGRGMANGMVPYRDFFDHKGPLIYFINFIGCLINDFHGIWLLEVLAIFVSVVFSYLTVKKLFGRFAALLSVSAGFTLLSLSFECGNLTEEFALPLICIALYLFVTMILSDSLEWWKILICGFTFGLSLMLRPNMFAVWFVFSAYFVLSKLIKKEFAKAVKYAVLFFAGAIAAVAPFMIYLLLNGAFSDYIYQNFIFNSQYATYGLGTAKFFSQILDVTYSSSCSIVLGLVACVVGIADNKTEKHGRIVFALLFVSLAVSIIFVSASNKIYNHYYMVLIPLVTVAISILLSRFRALVSKNNIRKITSDLIVVAVAFCVFGNSALFLMTAAAYINVPEHEEQEAKVVADFIERNADDDDTVQAVGANCLIYLHCDLKPASKFIYDAPIAVISDEVHQFFVEEWEKAPPTYAVCGEEYFERRDEKHINWVLTQLEADYETVYQGEKYTVFRRLDNG